MHVKTRQMAFSGVLLALALLLLYLSGVLSFNTLFLLAAASFLVGIIVREFGLYPGAAFYAAAILLGFFLAPNKLYCVTFGGMGLYILAREAVWNLLGKWNTALNRTRLFFAIKYLIFNAMYIPALLFLPRLLFTKTYGRLWLWAAFAAGQAVFFLYDRAYEYFQAQVWSRYRGRFWSGGGQNL